MVLAAIIAFPARAAGLDPGQSQDPAGRVEALFADYARPGSPGCAVGVARDGQIVFMKGFGRASLEHELPITPETTFNIGSVGKQFTALAVLLLEQRRQLSLDDDVRRYVPELRDHGAPIRVRDLLQHTSGLRDYGTLGRLAAWPARTMPEFLDLMARQRGLNFEPGARHGYSHSDYTLLAIVVERVTGEPLGDFLAREIWAPLGMSSTRLDDGRAVPVAGRAFAYAVAEPGHRARFPSTELVGGNNVYSSVHDLLRWEQEFRTGKLGGPELVARMLARPKLASGATIPYAFGLMLGEYRGLRTVYRGGSGGGFATEMLRFPDQGLAVVVLCNLTPAQPMRMCESVAELYLADHMRATPARREPESTAAPREELERCAGWYASVDDPWNVSRIVAQDGGLREVVGEQVYALSRLADGRYRDGELLYSFTTPVEGRPSRLSLESPTTSETLVRRPTDELWKPSASDLAGYAGSFYSEDLGVVWDFSIVDGSLALRRARAVVARPMPVDRDLFQAELGSPDESLTVGLEFGRGADETVTQLTVTALPAPYEIARDVRFERITRR